VVLKIKNLTSSLKLHIMHSSRNVEQEGALPQLPMPVLAHHSGSASPLYLLVTCRFSTKAFIAEPSSIWLSGWVPINHLAPWLLKMLFGMPFFVLLRVASLFTVLRDLANSLPWSNIDMANCHCLKFISILHEIVSISLAFKPFHISRLLK